MVLAGRPGLLAPGPTTLARRGPLNFEEGRHGLDVQALSVVELLHQHQVGRIVKVAIADLHFTLREPRLGLQALRVWHSRVGLAGDEVQGATWRDVDGLPLAAAVGLHAAAWDVVTLGLVDAVVEGDRIRAVGPGRHVRLGIAAGAVDGEEGYVLAGDWLAVRVVHMTAYDVAAVFRRRRRGLRRRWGRSGDQEVEAAVPVDDHLGDGLGRIRYHLAGLSRLGAERLVHAGWQGEGVSASGIGDRAMQAAGSARSKVGGKLEGDSHVRHRSGRAGAGTPSHRYLRGVRSRGGRSLRRSRYGWRLNPRGPGATSCRTATERQRQSRCSGGLCDSVHHRDAHSKLVHRGQRACNALLLGMDARQRNAGSPRRSSHRITHSFAWRSARQVPPGRARQGCSVQSAFGSGLAIAG